MKNDDELDEFEENLRLLKNKYDQFFAGISKVPPMMERHKMEAYIHELGKKKIRDNARRFRFNTLLSRYNQYREMWGRRMREREEGPLEFRRRAAAMNEPAPEKQPPPIPAPMPHHAVTSGQSDPYVRVAAGTNGEAIGRLYEQIRDEHEKLGRPPNLTREQLSAMVDKQVEIVRARYNVSTVAFRVETIDGKVKLKAKPIQE
ncbi:MAG TPA: MXAN_5187 C-terminal domain-containing protein [Thermoanaerobaculia bacterium]|nr:MXAN_5187 C-terminal domain-containing protein [Thermoanaerobaculia bacterium]